MQYHTIYVKFKYIEYETMLWLYIYMQQTCVEMHWNDNYQIQDSSYLCRVGNELHLGRRYIESFKSICNAFFISSGCKKFILLFFIGLPILNNFIINNSLPTITSFQILAVELSSRIGETSLLKLRHADIQAQLRDIACLIPDHHNKTLFCNIAIK